MILDLGPRKTGSGGGTTGLTGSEVTINVLSGVHISTLIRTDTSKEFVTTITTSFTAYGMFYLTGDLDTISLRETVDLIGTDCEIKTIGASGWLVLPTAENVMLTLQKKSSGGGTIGI